ncbi:NAD-dependent protein deacetylase sirtuin-3-like [Macrobrachium nipponense]|uniref:NAD-dependent protein deacetylase sirtuin-3-like n=1 Tax=Macrobrachium nipponense TaxID=159736 RepID=UPI0030C826B8
MYCHSKIAVLRASVRPMRLPTRNYVSLIDKGLNLSLGRHNGTFYRQYSSILNNSTKLQSIKSPLTDSAFETTGLSCDQVRLFSRGINLNNKNRKIGKWLLCCSGVPQKLPPTSYSILRTAQQQYSGVINHHPPWSTASSQARCFSTSDSSSSESDKIYEEVADMIKCNATNILVMAGAGISTPSGIPDFRTPGTGLYDNLQKYNLPYPEAIFDIHYFMMDPRPFIALAQELYPGVNYKPNIAHYFIRLLFENQKLQKLYTQNIDGLERMAGIPETKLMEAHGTFATASCTLCSKIYPGEKVKEAILNGEVPLCLETKCKGKVKPDIVFFGENLPMQFWNYHTEVHFTDLLLVIGTSLEVYPFAGIADAVSRQTPRVLINRELVGSFGTRANDYMLLGDLTSSVKRLVKSIGWENELKDLTKDH